MRLGLLSDVHANAPALSAVLARLHGQVEAYVVAGDLVGYGAFPNECVERIAALDAAVVVGNHDLLVLGRLPPQRFPDYGLAAAEWTREVLRPDLRSYLDALPQVDGRDSVMVAHGSLDDPQEYVLTDERARDQVAATQQRRPGVETLVLGHTHQQWLWNERRSLRDPAPGTVLALRGPRLVNPGSVGQSRRREKVPLARAAVLDLDEARVSFLSVPYDVEAARAAAVRAGLDRRSVHAPLPRAPRARRALGRLRRAVRR